MVRAVHPATGRSLRGRPVAFLAAAALCVCGCDKVPGVGDGPPVLELADDTIQLERGTALIELRIHAIGDSAGIRPAESRAAPGDVVRFTAADEMTHAIAFDEAGLAADAKAFLEGTGQLRSPPLVESGTSWVVSLEGAPPGEYPFLCLSHEHRGRLTVAAAK